MPSYSRTAEYMALFRALESRAGRDARLFCDPLASRFLRPGLRVAAEAARVPAVRGALCRYIDGRWPGARTSGVARTRFIDDAVEAAVGEGVGQAVVLGAGFDSRAYRLACLRDVAVFEVDHPDTSQRKRERVTRVLGRAPAHVRFVPVDFNSDDAAAALRAAGLDFGRRTLFIWEGVTNYLDAAGVDATLRMVAACAAESLVVFTYVDRAVLAHGDARFADAAGARDLVRAVGEPWRFGFDPAELRPYLRARGLVLRSDFGAAAYRAMYWPDTASSMTGYAFYRIAIAEVAARAEG